MPQAAHERLAHEMSGSGNARALRARDEPLALSTNCKRLCSRRSRYGFAAHLEPEALAHDTRRSR
jgi:hypothetical protein